MIVGQPTFGFQEIHCRLVVVVRRKKSRKLKEKLSKAIQKERFGEALRLYDSLQTLEPTEPRWPHREGDLLQRLKRTPEAIDSYEKAVELYTEQGFMARAAAMAKVVLSIDPTRSDVLDLLDQDASRRLYRLTRTTGTHPAAEPHEIDDESPTQRRLIADALPLVADPDAIGDQLRFTKPPTREAEMIELEVSDLEVAGRPPTPATESSRDPTAEDVAQLPSMPLFADVPQEVLARLVKESRLVDLEDGQRLVEAGTTADALYALIEGSVELQWRNDEERIVLWEGDVVGVSTLLAHANYEADATARGRVRAMRISKLLLDRLVEEYPDLGDVLIEILGRRLVSTLVRTSPVFSVFDDGTRSEVANMFEVRRACEGTKLLEAEKRTDGLYIPLHGQLRAEDASGKELGKVKRGRALGQHSLLTDAVSPVTVLASTEVLVLRMPADRFHELVERHPRIVAHLRELARRPSQQTLSLFPQAPSKDAIA